MDTELDNFIFCQVWTGGYPCVFKIGHAHGGLGKVKVENDAGFEDMKGVVAVSNQYCTIEKFVEAYCDLHVFKIGEHYKALMRKSLSGNWKTNVGDVEIKEVTVQERYKKWIDEASAMFGGLRLCSLEAIVDNSGQEYIIEINDCAMGLMGDGQDEDRKLIAEIVVKDMEEKCKIPEEKPTPAPSETANESRPQSVQSNISAENGTNDEKVEKESKKSEKEEKHEKKHKRDKSEEKARKAEKEARRAEKEAKRERERRREEERIRREKEEEERRKEEERKRIEEERRRKFDDSDDESEPSVISRQQTKESEDSESDSASEDSDSASLSSNASSTIEKKPKSAAPAKGKI